jgi:hypothetical protein
VGIVLPLTPVKCHPGRWRAETVWIAMLFSARLIRAAGCRTFVDPARPWRSLSSDRSAGGFVGNAMMALTSH